MRFILLLIFLFSFSLMADCKWSNIQKTNDGYLYPVECHAEVGKIIKQNEMHKEEIKNLRKAIELKDLVINQYDARIMLWRDTSYKLEDRLMKQHKYSSYQNWAYFIGGVGLTVLSAWAMGQVSK
jgi:hypothetical protein